MSGFIGNSSEDLRLLGDSTNAFVGRKGPVHSEHGRDGALLLGQLAERAGEGRCVYLDALSPHVIFVCGSRGSGKSYVLGVIAEELILRNPGVACVVIDPVGIFWSMKYPNREAKELAELVRWGLEPRGIDRTQVFIPLGMKKRVPEGTYDRLFSIRPSELTVDDWCLTFGLERFSPTSLLLEKAIEKAQERFKAGYDIADLIDIVEKDPELTSRERGYKQDTRRALVSRLEAAKSWAVLSKEGTSLSEICKEGYVTVIDISFLEENVASLVIGLLSRKVLNARKLVTRKDAMEKYTMDNIDELLNVQIPPTWLFIDEAHTLIPAGSAKTAATDSLIEYVKQGRRPGCSLVFATQQPSAIDTRVLSQLDMVLCHKLVFDEDLKAVMRRMPTSVPKEYENTRFVKTLPVGIALLGDRSEETSRAFCLKVRPRFSQHEGRETKSMDTGGRVDPASIRDLILGLVSKELNERGSISRARIDEISETIKRRYDVKLEAGDILGALRSKGYDVGEADVKVRGFERKQETTTGERAFAITIDEAKARSLAERKRGKKALGLFGSEEELTDIRLAYEPVYKVNYELVLDRGYKPLACYVGPNYEIYYWDRGLRRIDTGRIIGLDDKRLRLLNALKKANEPKKLMERTKLTPQAVAKYLKELVEAGLATEKDGKYRPAGKLDLPETLDSPAFSGLEEKFPLSKAENPEVEEAMVDEKQVSRIPQLFGNCRVKSVETILKPVWKAAYKSAKGVRVEKIDAIG